MRSYIHIYIYISHNRSSNQNSFEIRLLYHRDYHTIRIDIQMGFSEMKNISLCLVLPIGCDMTVSVSSQSDFKGLSTFHCQLHWNHSVPPLLLTPLKSLCPTTETLLCQLLRNHSCRQLRLSTVNPIKATLPYHHYNLFAVKPFKITLSDQGDFLLSIPSKLLLPGNCDFLEVYPIEVTPYHHYNLFAVNSIKITLFEHWYFPLSTPLKSHHTTTITFLLSSPSKSLPLITETFHCQPLFSHSLPSLSLLAVNAFDCTLLTNWKYHTICTQMKSVCQSWLTADSGVN